MTFLEETVLERFRSLLQRSIPLTMLAAFGSRVRSSSLVQNNENETNNDSDLDVLVVSEILTPAIRLLVSDCAFEAGFDAGILISPVVYSQAEWEQSPEASSTLAQSIRREGVFLAI